VTAALAGSLARMGIRDVRVLEVMAELDRAAFVPGRLRGDADDDRPLPIGHGQTISQPLVVAYMTELLRLSGPERVLEVGTGSGYQTAVLARLALEVYSIEIVPELAARAAAALAAAGIRNVHLRTGDGAEGWPEAAPFDRILVTAAAPEVPAPLVEQLARGGRMVIPVGSSWFGQRLLVIDKRADGEVVQKSVLAVRFVPLTGPGVNGARERR
jgi:protein-L-isoaspartate(D-aspartate) O-methyltransferase